MDGFALTKWYIDCVDGHGRSAMVYSSALAWGRATVSWHSLSIHQPGIDPTHDSSLARLALPGREGPRVFWQARPLGCTVICRPARAPFSQRLLEQADGFVDWQCEASAATVEIELAGQPGLCGTGYAERLVMTLPPWRLPIEELRWGRWVSDDACRSLVWIDWQGPAPRTDVYMDGQPQAPARVADDRVQAGKAVLVLAERRTLYSRSLGSALAGLGPILSMLPSSWRAVDDTKWIRRAHLDVPGTPAEEGWCIHEQVRFPR